MKFFYVVVVDNVIIDVVILVAWCNINVDEMRASSYDVVALVGI